MARGPIKKSIMVGDEIPSGIEFEEDGSEGLYDPEDPVRPMPEALATEIVAPMSSVRGRKLKSEGKEKIRVNVNHFCNIGGERYDFKKNEIYEVPIQVKLILQRANLLAPL